MRRLVATALLAASILSLLGCSGTPEPNRESRQVLGTAITVTVYDEAPGLAKARIGEAFDAMSAVEHQLSPYDASSSVSAFNLAPYETHALPADARRIVAAVARLGVQREFSGALFGVTRLYGFGATETVPADDALAAAVALAGTFEMAPDGTARFGAPDATTVPSLPPDPGLDFGGASKGLALDDAMRVLTRGGPPSKGSAALITAGSSTLAAGSKPDGEPWRIGIEDPRGPGRVVATVEATGTLSVSTSGDYQVYFERGGVRYHHILDPATGRPARGLRSLTVFGRISGVDADILSTALFVMGADRALAYAAGRDIGVVAVDDTGQLLTRVPSSLKGVTLSRQSDPLR